MKKELSSSMTMFLKYIFPAILAVVVFVGAIIAFATHSMIGVIVLIPIAIFGVVITLFSQKMKEVEIGDEFLYISNLQKTIKIPHSEIIRATEADYSSSSSRIITIDLKVKTAFGREIVFMSYTDVFVVFSLHPVTKLLQSKIEAARNKE